MNQPLSGRQSPGFEGQRKADQGDGTFLNPILSGDHPDPSILRDGDDFYLTYSTFETYPGLPIWHSRDLINWQPLTSALHQNVGSVWAPELIKHDGRFYIYIATKPTSSPSSKKTNWVIWADDIEGPWSDPIDLHLPTHIDPGHAVGEDGSRWLFLSRGDRIRLSDNGLATVGLAEHVYDGWRYPDDWDVEGYAQEGPKIAKHGDYFYLISAVGGTAGPPTGHMVIVARSKSIHGPWENHPRNPVVRTQNIEEKWWSRGHATFVSLQNGDWWSVLHGYENGFWTLGRQTLLAPVYWTEDGWPEFGGDDLSAPLPVPLPAAKRTIDRPHGFPLSDTFLINKYGIQWCFFNPAPDEKERMRYHNSALELAGRGTAPSNSSPLTCIVGDQSYQVDCEIEIEPEGGAGLLLFYNSSLYCGIGVREDHFVTHQYGRERTRVQHEYGLRLFVRLRNQRHIVSIYTSSNGETWQRFDRGMEVSGYHHNVSGGFQMLKPAIYATGEGTKAIFRKFTFRAFP
ncbi:family 43 glycosylhydrolase [uncultured Cohaesibacter sp.]|uniref:family 43 glycosylhydrolase n=1 Tax=uncultured Cohaesibacter sp. TaxID=1002546 RepID=UPI00292E1603|nr:family 43 glycosylhydrolase [uncultured Cohaesibacter sp.]